jgi:hypothetical protein
MSNRNSCTSLDDIVVELSADLEAATKAQTEPVLQPKRPGHGVAAIRAHIQKQFEHIHDDLARSMREVVVCDVEVEVVETTPRKPRAVKAEKSLAEKAEIILKDCEHTHRHTPVRRAGLHRCHYITVPTESAEQLIEQAMRLYAPKKEDKDTTPPFRFRVVAR